MTCALHTCDCAFAGISCGQGSDAIRGVWYFITTILDENGVTASHVRHIGHKVRPILIITNVSLLWLPFRVLTQALRTKQCIKKVVRVSSYFMAVKRSISSQ